MNVVVLIPGEFFLKNDEKWQQDLLVKRAAEEEERAHKLAEARRALDLKREREQEWEWELEKERQAFAER